MFYSGYYFTISSQSNARVRKLHNLNKVRVDFITQPSNANNPRKIQHQINK